MARIIISQQIFPNSYATACFKPTSAELNQAGIFRTLYRLGYSAGATIPPGKRYFFLPWKSRKNPIAAASFEVCDFFSASIFSKFSVDQRRTRFNQRRFHFDHSSAEKKSHLVKIGNCVRSDWTYYCDPSGLQNSSTATLFHFFLAAVVAQQSSSRHEWKVILKTWVQIPPGT